MGLAGCRMGCSSGAATGGAGFGAGVSAESSGGSAGSSSADRATRPGPPGTAGFTNRSLGLRGYNETSTVSYKYYQWTGTSSVLTKGRVGQKSLCGVFIFWYKIKTLKK